MGLGMDHILASKARLKYGQPDTCSLEAPACVRERKPHVGHDARGSFAGAVGLLNKDAPSVPRDALGFGKMQQLPGPAAAGLCFML